MALCSPVSGPLVNVVCPPGYFCGNISNISANEEFVLAKIRFEDLDLAPGDPVPSWIEDSCVSGTYCPSGGLDMIECPAGSWCPNGMDRTLVCDSLSSCPVRSGYQVRNVGWW